MSTLPPSGDFLPPADRPAPEQGIDLLAILAALLTQWRLALAVWAVAIVVSLVLIFSLPSRFVATATILPQASRSEGDSLASLFSPRNPGVIFIGLLQSRSVANDVIDRLHLLNTYHTSSYDTARTRLGGQSTFTIGADSLLTISIKDESAQNASAIANAYLASLEDLNLSMAQDQSRLVQSFFQQQLQQERENLNDAEMKLEQTQKQTGLVQPETQTQLGLNAIQSTRAQIVSLQVELAALLQSETEQNPQVQRLRSQIAQLQAQESTMESGGRSSPVGAAPSASQLPQGNLDYLRAQREVRFHDQLVTSLSSQFETARLNQDLSRPAFQVVDRAIAPEHKAWPPRRLFLMAAVAFGFLLGLFAIVVRLTLVRILSDPANAPSLQAIRQAFAAPRR